MTDLETKMAAIRAREADPETNRGATEVALAIGARVDKAARSALTHQAIRASSSRTKIFLLRKVADDLGAAAAPVVACTKGCSHCCSMPVMIGATEAVQIAAETGAKMTRPAKYDFPPKADLLFDGVPCTFLVDGACSIYNSRPLACRHHFVVDRDETLCEIFPGVKIVAPHLNVDYYHKGQATAFGPAEFMQMADVRAFFPRGLGGKK